MRTFKEHILEKLKVTSKKFITPTYQEYYDLLYRYCKTNSEKFLDLDIVFDFDDDLLPKYEYNKKRVISTLRPLFPSDPEIVIKTRDLDLEKSFFYSAYVSDTPNEEVDFMSDEAIEKTVNYMKEHIKEYENIITIYK